MKENKYRVIIWDTRNLSPKIVSNKIVKNFDVAYKQLQKNSGRYLEVHIFPVDSKGNPKNL